MKAKIKETGEIVDLVNYGVNGDYTNYISSDGEMHHSLLNFYNDFEEFKEVDWEERRYEIAKAVIPGLIAANKQIDNAVTLSIEVADKLINQLKEG